MLPGPWAVPGTPGGTPPSRLIHLLKKVIRTSRRGKARRPRPTLRPARAEASLCRYRSLAGFRFQMVTALSQAHWPRQPELRLTSSGWATRPLSARNSVTDSGVRVAGPGLPLHATAPSQALVPGRGGWSDVLRTDRDAHGRGSRAAATARRRRPGITVTPPRPGPGGGPPRRPAAGGAGSRVAPSQAMLEAESNLNSLQRRRFPPAKSTARRRTWPCRGPTDGRPARGRAAAPRC